MTKCHSKQSAIPPIPDHNHPEEKGQCCSVLGLVVDGRSWLIAWFGPAFCGVLWAKNNTNVGPPFAVLFSAIWTRLGDWSVQFAMEHIAFTTALLTFFIVRSYGRLQQQPSSLWSWRLFVTQLQPSSLVSVLTVRSNLWIFATPGSSFNTCAKMDGSSQGGYKQLEIDTRILNLQDRTSSPIPLPETFQPGEWDVICCGGKEAAEHGMYCTFTSCCINEYAEQYHDSQRS